MRTLAFWLWFVIAAISLGRLWSTLEAGLLAHASTVDALALVTLIVALVVLVRAQNRAVRAAMSSRAPERESLAQYAKRERSQPWPP